MTLLNGTMAAQSAFHTLKKFVSQKSWPVSRVLSRTVIHLGLLSPTTSSSLPESDADHTIWFLFGLAPSGVYLAIIVTNNAVRSYHTISPLPHIKKRGGIFSVALSVNSHSPDVIWHSVLRSPDFPPMLKSYRRLPSQLDWKVMSKYDQIQIAELAFILFSALIWCPCYIRLAFLPQALSRLF